VQRAYFVEHEFRQLSVFEMSGACFSDAFSATTFNVAAGGIEQGNRGLVLYM
jgi:hypothetical protein